MANIKCYSGGKCVKSFKNIDTDCVDVSPVDRTGYSNSVTSTSGFSILSKDGESILFDWRGDFLVEW
jgi:hypothetical protein